MSELKAIGRVPSSEAERKQIAQPLLDILDDYVKIIMENVKDAVIRGAKNVIEELNKLEETKESSKSIDIAQKVSLPFDAEEYSELISEQLKNKTFEASQRTLDRLSGNIMDNLAKSYELGLGIDDAADRLNDVFQSMEDYELTMVARTEINSAQNFGAMLTEEQLGVEYHQWWTAEDERVRATHANLHGQIVKVGHPFSNGLIRPGDTNGDPSEFINCRCRVVPFLMPEGKTAPSGVDYFYEDDLVDIKTPETIEYQPVMSEEKAREWAKDSVFKEEVYHGTSEMGRESILKNGFDPDIGIMNQGSPGAYGPGIYFGNKSLATQYEASGGAPLRVMLNVKKGITEDVLYSYYPKVTEQANLTEMFYRVGARNYDDALREATKRGIPQLIEGVEKIGKEEFNHIMDIHKQFANAKRGSPVKSKLWLERVVKDGYDHFVPLGHDESTRIVVVFKKECITVIQ